MFQHILVPLDGSGLAEAALPVSECLAGHLGAKVTLMHVLEKNAPTEVHGQAHLGNADDAARYLNQVAERFRSKGIETDIHVHEIVVTDVADSIVEHAGELHHDLIVMCSHGRERALHLFLGNIPQKIAGLGTIPVLVTHPLLDGSADTFSCSSILLAWDGDPEHSAALPVARDLAVSCGSKLHVLTVIPEFGNLAGQGAVVSRFLPGTTSRLLEYSVQQAKDQLECQVNDFQAHGVRAASYVLRGDPARQIVDLAQKLEAEMIVLGTHGRSGVVALFEGSIAHKICGAWTRPLLLVPVKEGK